MPDRSMTFSTLALFTSAERAEAIEGDLIEQSINRRQICRAITIFGVVCHLVIATWRAAPLKISALSLACLVLPFLASNAIALAVHQLARGTLLAEYVALSIPLVFFLTGRALVRFSHETGVSTACWTALVLTALTCLLGASIVGGWILRMYSAYADWSIAWGVARMQLGDYLIYPLIVWNLLMSLPLVLGSIWERAAQVKRNLAFG